MPLLSAKNILAIRLYVQECKRNALSGNNACMKNNTVENRISLILSEQEPLLKEKIVWRGHVREPNYILSTSWFSVTDKKLVAKTLFTNNVSECCLFKIHVMPGVRMLDIRHILSSNLTRKNRNNKTRKNKNLRNLLEEEREFLVEDGGIFYKNKEGTEEGFVDKDDYYETYYYPKQQLSESKELTAEELKNFVDKDEYEFIDDISYFNIGVIPAGFKVSRNTKQKALELIRKEVPTV